MRSPGRAPKKRRGNRSVRGEGRLFAIRPGVRRSLQGLVCALGRGLQAAPLVFWVLLWGRVPGSCSPRCCSLVCP